MQSFGHFANTVMMRDDKRRTQAVIFRREVMRASAPTRRVISRLVQNFGYGTPSQFSHLILLGRH